jgi:hypothetical protein
MAVTTTDAAKAFETAFPPSPDWRLHAPHPDYKYTPHFRPYRDTWEEARDQIANGSTSVTVEGIWGDGRVGRVTLQLDAPAGEWRVTELWHQGNGQVP